MTQYAISPAAAAIINNKGRFWEFRLLAQLTDEYVAKAAVSHGDDVRVTAEVSDATVLDISYTAEGLLGVAQWIKQELNEMRSPIKSLERIIRERPESLFGAVGEPGDQDQIAGLAERIAALLVPAASFERRMHSVRWQLADDFSPEVAAVVVDTLRRAHGYLLAGSVSIRMFYADYGKALVQQLDRILAAEEPGVTLKLNLVNYTYPPIDEALFSNIEQLTQAAELAAQDDRRVGFLYVMINSSMPGIVKIGKTTRAAEDRAKELGSATGVPTPFVLVYDVKVDDCHEAEKKVHALLSHCRVADNREFFRIPVKDAINVLMAAGGESDSAA